MFEDLTNKTFGKLLVIERAENKNNQTMWLCECQCIDKTLKVVRGNHLKLGRIQSCGCLYKERIRSKVPLNIFEFREDYKVGYTDTNREFYYDIDDAKLIEQYSWYFDKDGYVIARINRKGIKIHRLLLGIEDEKVKIDHRNKHRYDNRKNNLRIASNSQNGMNIKIRKNNKSGVTGVGWHNGNNCWRARITINKKTINLGWFDDFDEAVRSRKKAEKKYFGEFAPIN
jgi:hypothetical protein